MIQDKKAVILLNKSDLATVVSKDMLKSYIEKPMIEISAKEESGIKELEQTLKDMFSMEIFLLMMRFILQIFVIRRQFRMLMTVWKK